MTAKLKIMKNQYKSTL